MKMIKLNNLRDCLRDGQPEVVVDPDMADRARVAHRSYACGEAVTFRQGV